MTILLVDDDRNCIDLWTRLLSGLSATILHALTIDGALKQMTEIPPPDLVLLDLKIPPWTPDQSLMAVHAFREFNPNLAVLAISGMRLDEILMAIETAGVVIQGAITKDDSLSQARLLDSVKAAMIKGKNFKDTLATLETMHDAMEKKRTDRIDLPPNP